VINRNGRDAIRAEKIGSQAYQELRQQHRSYVCLLGRYYAWLAYQHGLLTVTIDLLELRIEPAEFDIERNRILAGMCQCTLLRNTEQLAPPGNVISAVLTTHFGIDD